MSQPLRCHNPKHPWPNRHHASVTVEEARQMLRRGVKKLHAYCRCDVCGWVWWSSHKTALALSRKAEAEHKPGAP